MASDSPLPCRSLAHVTIITIIFHNSLDYGTIFILHQEKDALHWVGAFFKHNNSSIAIVCLQDRLPKIMTGYIKLLSHSA